MRTSTATEKDAKERLRHDFKTEQSVPTDRAWRTMEPRGPELPGPARLRRGSAPEAALWLWATGRSARTVGSRRTRCPPCLLRQAGVAGRAVPSLGRGRGRREALRLFPRPGCSQNPRSFLISPHDFLDCLPQAQQLPVRASALVSWGRGLRRKQSEGLGLCSPLHLYPLEESNSPGACMRHLPTHPPQPQA